MNPVLMSDQRTTNQHTDWRRRMRSRINPLLVLSLA